MKTAETVRFRMKAFKQVKEIQEYILIHKGIHLDFEEVVKFCVNECHVKSKKNKL